MKILHHVVNSIILLILCCVYCSATVVNKDDFNPSLSYHGKVTAFLRGGDDAGYNRIMLYINGTQRLLTITKNTQAQPGERKPKIIGHPQFDTASCPVMSPDGWKVVWTHSASDGAQIPEFRRLGLDADFQNVYVTDIRSGKVTRLTQHGGTAPVWSPDSRWVAYVTPRGALEATEIGTGHTKVIVKKLLAAQNISWLKSGLAIAIEKERYVAWYSITPSGNYKKITKQVKLPNPSGQVSRETWALSRDGSKVVYAFTENYVTNKTSDSTKYNEVCKVYLISPSGMLAVGKIDSSKYGSKVADGNRRLNISLAADGEQFALSIDGGIWRGDLRTGKLRQITQPRY